MLTGCCGACRFGRVSFGINLSVVAPGAAECCDDVLQRAWLVHSDPQYLRYDRILPPRNTERLINGAGRCK